MILKESRPLTSDIQLWRLTGPHDPIEPGQFAQVAVPGFYLRRPISICDWTADSVTLVFRQVGPGTQAMAAMPAGCGIDLLCPLGHGFDISRCGAAPLLAGGGVGLPPLIGLARALLAAGKKPTLLAGFRSASDCFLMDEAEALGVRTAVVTEDGSAGMKGLITDALPTLSFDSLCACGPLPMLRALYSRLGGIPAQYSLEERMGCGFGACMGCSVMTRIGPQRVCAEGPVFPGEVLDW